MKKRILILLTVSSMAGCAANPDTLNVMNPESQFQSVDCLAIYQVKTFSHAGYYNVKIDMVQINRVGNIYVKPVKGASGIKFQGPWQSEKTFVGFKCESKGGLENQLHTLFKGVNFTSE